MYLADAFIQSDLQCIQAIHLYCQYVCSLGIEPTTFALLTQCSKHWARGTKSIPQSFYALFHRLESLFPSLILRDSASLRYTFYS